MRLSFNVRFAFPLFFSIRVTILRDKYNVHVFAVHTCINKQSKKKQKMMIFFVILNQPEDTFQMLVSSEIGGTSCLKC